MRCMSLSPASCAMQYDPLGLVGCVMNKEVTFVKVDLASQLCLVFVCSPTHSEFACRPPLPIISLAWPQNE